MAPPPQRRGGGCSLALFAAAAALAPCDAQHTAGSSTGLPHLIFNLIDDFGWANVGYHRPAGFNETVTPNSEFPPRASRARAPRTSSRLSSPRVPRCSGRARRRRCAAGSILCAQILQPVPLIISDGSHAYPVRAPLSRPPQ
jgi:hypothetical protein